MPNHTVSTQDGVQALDHNAVSLGLAGYATDSGCTLSVNTGILGAGESALTLSSGTAYVGGSKLSVDEQVVDIPVADPTNPRRDVVFVDSNGEAVTRKGVAEPADPSRVDVWTQYMRPAPDSLDDFPGAPVAEVFVAAGSSKVSIDEVRHVQIDEVYALSGAGDSALQTDGSNSMNALLDVSTYGLTGTASGTTVDSLVPYHYSDIETGWSTGVLEIRKGRMDFRPKDGKGEMRMHGSGASWTVYQMTDGVRLLSADANGLDSAGVPLYDQGSRVATRTWASGSNISHSELADRPSGAHHSRPSAGEGLSESSGSFGLDVVASGSVSLSSGVATVDTGVGTGSGNATFFAALGGDSAGQHVAAEVYPDSGTGTYLVDIVHTNGSGSFSVDYDVVRVS